MSKEEKKEQDEAGEEKKGGIAGLLTKLPVLISGVMIVEAAVLFIGFNMLKGGPDHADAAEVAVDDHGEVHGDGHGEEAPAHAPGELVEVAIDAFRAPNRLNGRTFLYDVEISVRVKAEVKEQVEGTLTNSTALVRDRMNRIIAQIDPQKLNGAVEPGLETLRRQVKYQLDLIVGEGLIEEVLVPRCIPYRTDY